MKNRKIVFEAPYQVALHQEEESLKPAAGELLVETQVSLISTGTELACLSGGEDWFKMPATPGYCCVSKVLEAGEGMEDYHPGDLVFHYGMHARYQLTSPNPWNLIAKVPEGADAEAFAETMAANANPSKWICVTAESVQTAVKGNLVLLVMSAQATADAIVENFNAL